MNNGDIALACTRVFVDELTRQGIDAVCISPGSRSTPLALAFARDGRFSVHVHLDERSSAFFALGRAKATGKPTALVCTSGTATANYLPAVVEASQSRVPMLVLTADRPPASRGTGANQTIDQRGLYGVYARSFEEAPMPSLKAGASRTWRAFAARAVSAALGAPAGPAHLNLPFDEPLTPDDEPPELRDAPHPLLAEARVPRTRLSDVTWLARLIDEHQRGLILAGPMAEPAPAICDLAVAAGWPLLAEPLSNLRLPGHAMASPQAVLWNTSFVGAHPPDVVLQFGGAPTSRGALALAASTPRLVTVDADGWAADPARHAERIVTADAQSIATDAVSRLAEHPPTSWLKAWNEADRRARRALDTFLDSVDVGFEPRIARDVAASLPDGAQLLIGNSTPVRDLDVAMAPRNGLRVLGNRGASGIDGLVSTALGAASAGAPTTALIGDLSLLHDVGALLWSEESGVTFVVVDNGGGGIFDLLPSAVLPEHEELFVTPHANKLSRIRGIDRRVVDRRKARELRAAMREAVIDAVASKG